MTCNSIMGGAVCRWSSAAETAHRVSERRRDVTRSTNYCGQHGRREYLQSPPFLPHSLLLFFFRIPFFLFVFPFTNFLLNVTLFFIFLAHQPPHVKRTNIVSLHHNTTQTLTHLTSHHSHRITNTYYFLNNDALFSFLMHITMRYHTTSG